MFHDDEDIQRIVPREALVKQGISAATHLAGGVFLMIMSIGTKFTLLGMILSVVALVIGVGALISKDREGKKPGIVLTVAGVLGMVVRFGLPILKPFAATFLIMGAMGLFTSGIMKGIQFLRGLNSRR